MKKPKLPGLIGGLGITFKTMLKPAVTVQYPHEQEDPPAARGVIALKEENCTVCMLCARASVPTGASTSRATRRSARPAVRVAASAA